MSDSLADEFCVYPAICFCCCSTFFVLWSSPLWLLVVMQGAMTMYEPGRDEGYCGLFEMDSTIDVVILVMRTETTLECGKVGQVGWPNSPTLDARRRHGLNSSSSSPPAIMHEDVSYEIPRKEARTWLKRKEGRRGRLRVSEGGRGGVGGAIRRGKSERGQL